MVNLLVTAIIEYEHWRYFTTTIDCEAACLSDNSGGQFEFHCSSCSKKLRAKVRSVGMSLQCPSCGQKITVPKPTSSPVDELVRQAEPTPTEPPKASTQDDSASSASSSLVRPSLFDVDELHLDTAPLEDVEERKRLTETAQHEKEAQRLRRIAAQQPWEQPAPEEIIPAHSRRQSVESRFKDAYTLIDEKGQPITSSLPNEPMKPSVFDSDLPALAKDNKPAVHADPHSEASTSADEIAASLSGGSPISLNVDELMAQAPQDMVEEKYRVLCPTCGTVEYVERKAEGTMVRCPDCLSKFRAPPPPSNWTPSLVSTRHKQFNEAAPLVENDDIAEIDHKQQQRTKDILARAQSELESEEKDYPDKYVEFDTKGFFRRTFAFALDPMAVGQIFGFSIVFALSFALMQFGLNTDGSLFRKGAALFCMLCGPAIGIVFGMPMISAALAQLEAAANKQERVTDWPSLNVFENFGDILSVACATIAAAIPGVILGLWLGGDLETAGRIQLALAMVGVMFLFPIFFLSVLDNGSPLQLLSTDVLRSVRQVSEAWGGYYIKMLVFFALTIIAWVILLGKDKSPMQAAIAGMMVPSLVFFMFQQLGLLADAIGEKLSFAPKEKPSQDKTQELEGE